MAVPWLPVGCVAAGLVALHLLLLWAERRGWIRYMRTGGSAGSTAGLFGEMQALFGPAHRHTIEELERRELTSEQHVVADLELGVVRLTPPNAAAPPDTLVDHEQVGVLRSCNRPHKLVINIPPRPPDASRNPGVEP